MSSGVLNMFRNLQRKLNPRLGTGTVCLPLPLGEGRGEGLVRQARNNSPGFSPFSKRATSQFFYAVDAWEEFLNGLRAEARSNVVVAVWRSGPHPDPLPKGEGGDLYHYREVGDLVV